MGHHYIPQYYLKGFAEGGNDLLWAYKKGTGCKFCTQIKNIANMTKFYSPEVEQYMSDSIEGPANIVLDKIRNRDQIDENEKRTFAEYVAAMWKRVPRIKERLKEMAPDLAQKVSEKLNTDLDIIASQGPAKALLVEERRRQAKEILDNYAKEPPRAIWLANIPPYTAPRFVAALRAMTWTFLIFDDRPAFLTCDNPIFYFTSIGIGNSESEITFPISSKLTLLATWRSDLTQDYVKTTEQVVREINRRTAHNATKYIFHCREEYWIEPFIRKGKWELHRLP